MSNRKPIFRQNYFLFGTIQSKMTRRVIGFLMVVLVVTAAILYRMVSRQLAHGVSTGNDIVSNFQHVYLPLVIAINIFILVMVTLYVIFQTHKVTGPLVGIANQLKKFAEGNFSEKITIRKGDYPVDFTNSLNDTFDNIKQHIVKSKKELSELESDIENNLSIQMSTEDIDSIMRKVKKLSQELEYFQVESGEPVQEQQVLEQVS